MNNKMRGFFFCLISFFSLLFLFQLGNMAKSYRLSLQHRERGDIFLTEGKLDQALYEYDNAVKYLPGEAINYDRQAKCLSMMGKYWDALDACIRATVCEPKVADYWYHAAEILDCLGMSDKAQLYRQRASDLNRVKTLFHVG